MAAQFDARLAEFKEKVLPKLVKQIQPRQVILFGSRASGSALEDSDLDIIVISERFRDLPYHQRIFEVLWALQSPIPVEVLCYTPEDAQVKRQQIDWVAEALSQGVVLFESQDNP